MQVLFLIHNALKRVKCFEITTMKSFSTKG